MPLFESRENACSSLRVKAKNFRLVANDRQSSALSNLCQKNDPMLYEILMLADFQKVFQVGASVNLYDAAFFIFPYKALARLSKAENCRSLAASQPELFNLQLSALFIEMDNSICTVRVKFILYKTDDIIYIKVINER